MDEIKKERNEAKSEETTTPVYNDGQYKLEHDKIIIKSEIESEIVTETYGCNTCKENFTDKIALKIHMKVHMNENQYKCLTCKRIFKRGMSWARHIIKHRRTARKFSCELCNKKFINKGELKTHMEIHRRDLYKCSECDREFTGIENLKQHFQTHERERLQEGLLFSCEFCDMKLSTKNGLRLHINNHTLDNREFSHTCENREFSQTKILNTHLKTHSKERLQSSMDKIKKGRNEAESEKTKIPVYNDGQYKLEHDEISIKSETELESENVTETYGCKTCKKNFIDEFALKIHIKTHLDENRYKCLTCKRIFKCGMTWGVHLMKHRRTAREKISQTSSEEAGGLLSDVEGKSMNKCTTALSKIMKSETIYSAETEYINTAKPEFSCEFCDMKLSTKTGLRLHINNHTLENREFSQKKILNKHLKTHSKERLQKISQTSSEEAGGLLSDVEGKSMNKCTTALSKIMKSETMGSAETDLTEYVNTAKAEFSCKFCGKKLTSKKKVKQHMNIHARETLFKCFECDKEYIKEGYLIRHLKTHGKRRLKKTSQTSSEEAGGLLSDVEGKSMNKCKTALSKIMKSETMDSAETDLTEYINTAKPEPNIEENESSHLTYNTSYSETICKEEVMLSDEND